MTIASRNQISHYQESKSNLQSLVKQTCQVGLGFTVMLLVTAGRPSAFGLSVTVGLGIAFVAWSEVSLGQRKSWITLFLCLKMVYLCYNSLQEVTE